MTNPQNFRKIVSQWIQTVSDAINVPLTMGNDGVLAFTTPQSELVIVIEVPYEEYDFMCFYCEMLDFNAQNDQEKNLLCARLLALNSIQSETDRGALALSPGEEKVLYCKRYSIDSLQHVEAFASALTLFTKTALHLKNIIQQEQIQEELQASEVETIQELNSILV